MTRPHSLAPQSAADRDPGTAAAACPQPPRRRLAHPLAAAPAGGLRDALAAVITGLHACRPRLRSRPRPLARPWPATPACGCIGQRCSLHPAARCRPPLLLRAASLLASPSVGGDRAPLASGSLAHPPARRACGAPSLRSLRSSPRLAPLGRGVSGRPGPPSGAARSGRPRPSLAVWSLSLRSCCARAPRPPSGGHRPPVGLLVGLPARRGGIRATAGPARASQRWLRSGAASAYRPRSPRRIHCHPPVTAPRLTAASDRPPAVRRSPRRGTARPRSPCRCRRRG